MAFATGQQVKFRNSHGEFTGAIVSEIGPGLFEIQVDPDGRVYEISTIVTVQESEIDTAD